MRVRTTGVPGAEIVAAAGTEKNGTATDGFAAAGQGTVRGLNVINDEGDGEGDASAKR